MVNTRGHRQDNEASGSRQPNVEATPPPPPSLAQAIAAVLESREEQTELLRHLVHNSTRQRGRQEQGGQRATYADFLATHPPVFSDAEDPMEAENWLRVIESKFGLLLCIDNQKPLFAAQ